jgi:hypothetical protein
LTDENALVAILAPSDGVIDCKLVPVALLVLVEHSRTIAEGAEGSQCRNEGFANKFRTIGNALNRLEQVLIYLERNNLLLLFHGFHRLFLRVSSLIRCIAKSIITKYYKRVKGNGVPLGTRETQMAHRRGKGIRPFRITGAAIGPPFFGHIVDTTGSYKWAWVSLALLSALCVLLLVFVSEGKRKI